MQGFFLLEVLFKDPFKGIECRNVKINDLSKFLSVKYPKIKKNAKDVKIKMS